VPSRRYLQPVRRPGAPAGLQPRVNLPTLGPGGPQDPAFDALTAALYGDVAAFEAAAEAREAAAAAGARARAGLAQFDRRVELQRQQAGLPPEAARRPGRPKVPRWGDAYHDGSEDEDEERSAEDDTAPPRGPPGGLRSLPPNVRRSGPPARPIDPGPPGVSRGPPARPPAHTPKPRMPLPLPPKESTTVVLRLVPVPTATAEAEGGCALPPLPKPIWTVPNTLSASSVAKLLALQMRALVPVAPPDSAMQAARDVTAADVAMATSGAAVPQWQTMGALRRTADAAGLGELKVEFWRRAPAAAPPPPMPEVHEAQPMTTEAAHEADAHRAAPAGMDAAVPEEAAPAPDHVE
jgi:hypothetical protein